MRLGLLVLSIGKFGEKGYYNLQEIGLAKALCVHFDEVLIYKLIPSEQEKITEVLDNYPNVFLHFLPAKSIGTNGLANTKLLDKTLDALVCFSDTQLYVPSIYRWAYRHDILFFPYIGVIESHSASRLKQIFINWLFHRNLAIYRKCINFAKTQDINNALKIKGVENVFTMPVGIDTALLHQDYKDSAPVELKKKYGFIETDKILLFIGRLVEEKQPVKMIRLFAEALSRDCSFSLLIVGTGALERDVMAAADEMGVSDKIKRIDKLPNKNIWELYRMADVFVNLNKQEIFGMAILEAMYYECKVVAWEAPGPKLIIENGISGWLVSKDEQVIEKILDDKDLSEAAHERIINKFTWERTAERMIKIIKGND